MKSKVSKRLLFELYCKIISIIVGIESFVFIFVDIPNDYKWIAALISAAIFIIAFIAVLIYANNQNSVVVDLCCANLTVKFGDLFSEDGNKVISCNEYFDSIVDEKLISSKTLHGQVMNKYITDIKDFDKKIIADNGCINSIVGINKKNMMASKHNINLVHVLSSISLFLLPFQNLILNIKPIWICRITCFAWQTFGRS